MPDELEDLLSKHSAEIKKAVTQGLADGPQLSAMVTVRVDDDPSPWRIRESKWVTKPGVPAGLTQFQPTMPECAYELRVQGPVLNRHALNEGRAKFLQECEERGRDARKREVSAVLALIAAEAARTEPWKDWHHFKNTQMARLGITNASSWRLIATDPIAASAKEDDLGFEIVKDADETMPSTASVLLIQLRDGPVVERVVDDMNWSWVRNAGAANEGRLFFTVRFLLRPAKTVLVLSRNKPGLKRRLAPDWLVRRPCWRNSGG